MGKRHAHIGVKQVIPYEWIRRTARLTLSGMTAKDIRQELHATLALEGKRVQPGERSASTRAFLVNNLMAIWPSPDPDLALFRDIALEVLRKRPDQELAIHWAMISAAYPFWSNTARQTGRLLNLQAKITQAQIITRLKEQYGDRQTVSRYARFVVRSFVDWGVINEAAAKGCYEKAKTANITDYDMVSLLLHAALLASPEGKAPLNVLLSNPVFFPFHLPAMRGELLHRRSGSMRVVRYGLDEELVTLAG